MIPASWRIHPMSADDVEQDGALRRVVCAYALSSCSFLSPAATARVRVVNVVGFGGGMDGAAVDEAVCGEVEAHLAASERTAVALLWHGDHRRDDGMTRGIATAHARFPGRVCLVAVRGPSRDGHAAFFQSWKDVPGLLVEVDEEARGRAKAAVLAHTPEAENADFAKLGCLVHMHARADVVLAVGGGATVGMEAAFCHMAGLRRKEPFARRLPAWKVHCLFRALKDGGQEAPDVRVLAMMAPPEPERSLALARV